jgi:hypothetical protein
MPQRERQIAAKRDAGILAGLRRPKGGPRTVVVLKERLRAAVADASEVAAIETGDDDEESASIKMPGSLNCRANSTARAASSAQSRNSPRTTW